MRILADLLLIAAALFLPCWLALFLASVLFFVFDRFYELFFTALLMDLLYGVPLSRFGGFQFVLSLSAALLSIPLTFIKKRMRI